MGIKLELHIERLVLCAHQFWLATKLIVCALTFFTLAKQKGLYYHWSKSDSSLVSHMDRDKIGNYACMLHLIHVIPILLVTILVLDTCSMCIVPPIEILWPYETLLGHMWFV